MAGVRVAAGEHVAWFGALDPESGVVVTASGSTTALPGTEPGAVKVTPFSEYPGKGRATGGVRCHRFLKGEDTLVFAWAGDGTGAGGRRERRPGRAARARRQARRLGHAGVPADRRGRRPRRALAVRADCARLTACLCRSPGSRPSSSSRHRP